MNGISPLTWELTHQGLKYDRQWMLIDSDGNFITRREKPQLSLLRVSLVSNALLVQSSDDEITIAFASDLENEIRTKVWDSPVVGFVENPRINSFFSDFLKQEVRLIRKKESVERYEKIPGTDLETVTSFADSFAIHLLGTASLNWMNELLNHPVEIGNFRPNLLIQTVLPFEEDNWNHLSAGNIEIGKAKNCARCIMINVDPVHGERRKDVLSALAMHRTYHNKAYFGGLYYVKKTGILTVGDSLDFQIAG